MCQKVATATDGVPYAIIEAFVRICSTMARSIIGQIAEQMCER